MKRYVRWYCLLLALGPGLASAALIQDIKIDARNIAVTDPAFVLAYTRVRVGDDVDQRKISQDVKRLLETGRFSFVDTELRPTPAQDGFILTYIVDIKPRLDKPVDVAGAEAMGPRKIRKWLELEVGDPVDDAILNQRTQKVLEEYHQRYYFNARCTWTIDVNKQSGFAQVRLQVDEGPRGSIHQIEFTGNTYLPPGLDERFTAGLHRQPVYGKSVAPDELRAAMRQKTWNWFSFLTKQGVYNPEDLDTDRNTIRFLYQNHGYLDAQVGEPDIRPYQTGKLKAVYPIVEGIQYYLGTISLTGVSLFPETNLWALIKLKSGQRASMGQIQRTAADLRDYYQSRGYMRTTVKPLLNARSAEAIVDVQFVATESSLAYIRYIDIRGNTRTKDKVIRRELLVYPGQIYDLVSIRRGERILQNLGFFETVTSYPRETMDSGRDDLVYEVQEKRTGNLSLGAGYSSVDELVGFAELSQGNFDLFNWPSFIGDGQKLRLRAQIGSQTEDYEISFVEPWFLDRKLSLGVDLFDTKQNNLSAYYNQQKLGSAVTLGKPLNGFFQRANLRYTLMGVTVFDIADDAIQRIRDEKGTRTVSELKLTFVHDTRDNLFDPTRGNKTTLGGWFSGGPLGFDTDDYGLEAESMTYFPLWFDHVFFLRGWAEVVSEYGDDPDVHLFDRIFLGGPRTLRGFKYRYVSPYEEGQPIGGKSGAMATAEYIIPITKKVVRFATFYDIGNAWLDSYDFNLNEYCSDIGIGARLNIPGFPISLDYAWPLEVSGDVARTAARFNFWMGYRF